MSSEYRSYTKDSQEVVKGSNNSKVYSMCETMKVMVILPTYNEAENLPLMVQRLFNLGIEHLKILIVDDNSPDGTGQIADNLAQANPTKMEVIHRSGKLGLGTAYIAGFSRALKGDSDVIIQMDTDFSHPPEVIIQMLQQIKEFDVVVGSRYLKESHLDTNWGFLRKVLSWFANYYIRLVTGLKIKDTTGGFKCFRRSVLEMIALHKIKSIGYIFQTEMNYACQKKGFKMLELPIVFHQRIAGKSKMSFKVFGEALWRIWQFRFTP